jgi:hypothetical protein
MQDAGCGMRDAGYGMRDTGYEIRDTSDGLLEIRFTRNALSGDFATNRHG